MISFIVILGVAFDWLAGEPKRWHPLVGFGLIAKQVEGLLNRKDYPSNLSPGVLSILNRTRGIIALSLLCLPLPIIGWLCPPFAGSWAVEAFLLYLSIGHRSLLDHTQPITQALLRNDEASARDHTAMIVSRDKETLDIEVSAIESTLENGNDAIFGALFWFVLGGAAGAIFYRLVNTLDAMWGYRTERYNTFGWAAAKLDDVLNYLPARCTALSYALLSDPKNAFKCWREQASEHASPNGGPVISAGAGGLGVLLGGPTRYHGHWQDKPALGLGLAPTVFDIQRATRLVSHTLILWVSLIVAVDFILFLQRNGGGV